MNLKNQLHEIFQYYGDDNLKAPIFSREEWNDVGNLEDFKVTAKNNQDLFLHDLEKFKEEEFWNGVVKNPLNFKLQEREIEFVYSDYYTYQSLKKILNENIRNYPRELASVGNIGVCISLGVNATLISKDNPEKFLHVKRSNDVGVYPDMFSLVPSGGVDDNHETLGECAREEFEEELGVDCNVDFYYNGASIDLYSLGFNISALGVVNDLDLEKVKEKAEDNAEDDFEFQEYKIGDFDDIELKYDMYNTTPPAIYCLNRAKETRSKILED